MRLGFEEFTFDSDTHELLRDRQPVTLSPKAFQLLEILIDNRPKALSKSALHDRLWPDTFVVEANLSNLIGEVRRALDEDTRHPRFIRTVHRFGYAFGTATTDTPRGESVDVVCRISWTGGTVMLREGEHLIGREADAVVMLDSPSVSRRHARIRVTAEQTTFEDLGSKNGSFIRGRRLEGSIPLVDGDVVTIGVVELTIRMIRSAVPTESIF
jgi:DNA-binding winged helix-turn-helix (wHTH) protein